MRHRQTYRGWPVVLLLCLGAARCDKPDDAKAFAAPTVSPAQLRITPGSLATVTYRFAVAPDAVPLTDDYVVFVHAVGEENATLWTDDHQPSTPTSQWKPGSVIEYSRVMFVPSGAPPGQASLTIGLYSPKTNERAPLSGTTTGMRAYQVATLDVLDRPRPPTLYLDGWNNAEVTESGDAWRWTKAKSTLALQNPRQDATLVIIADQPSPLTWTQEVDVTVGSTIVDHFSLPPGAREVLEVRVPAAALGDSGLVRVTLSTGRTFIPRTIAALNNPDERVLGVRVLGAYFDTEDD